MKEKKTNKTSEISAFLLIYGGQTKQNIKNPHR